MILAVDVYYSQNDAIAAGVLFKNWADADVVNELIIPVSPIAEYQPGQFYKRELPCVMTLLEQLEVLPDYIIIDGYVYLDDAHKPGFGKYLYDALQGKVAIIGVAKKRFKGTPSDTVVFRRESKRALYVTAVGIEQTEAKYFIMQMHGHYRLPTMLRRVDQLSRRKELIVTIKI